MSTHSPWAGLLPDPLPPGWPPFLSNGPSRRHGLHLKRQALVGPGWMPPPPWIGQACIPPGLRPWRLCFGHSTTVKGSMLDACECGDVNVPQSSTVVFIAKMGLYERGRSLAGTWSTIICHAWDFCVVVWPHAWRPPLGLCVTVKPFHPFAVILGGDQPIHHKKRWVALPNG